MRIYLMLTLLVSFCGFSQVEVKTKKAVPLIEPTNILLNSGFKSAFGGKSRLFYTIELPKNTIEWFYVFTTSTEPVTPNLQLLSQLSKILDLSSLATLALNYIVVQEGTSFVDVFLTDKQNITLFKQKNFDGTWTHSTIGNYEKNSRTNTKDGKVRIDDITKGKVYLAFRNPSVTTAINVHIEAVAIVEKTEINNKEWSKTNKDKLYNQFKTTYKLNNPNLDDQQINDLTSCIIAKLILKYTPEDMSKLADFEIKAVYEDLLKLCKPENTTN